MKRKKCDLYTGWALTALIIISFFQLAGITGIAVLLYLGLRFSIAITLWRKKSRIAKIIGVLLVPELLFCYFLPKSVKNTIQILRHKNTLK